MNRIHAYREMRPWSQEELLGIMPGQDDYSDDPRDETHNPNDVYVFVPPDTLDDERRALVSGHLHLIARAVRTVQRFRGRALDTEEATLDAASGLVRAGRRFDPSRGTNFGTYARPVVRSSIIDGERAFHKLQGPDKRDATVVSLFNGTRARSISAPLSPHTTLTLLDVLPAATQPPEEAAQSNIDRQAFYAGLSPLTPRQQNIVKLKAHGYSHQEIGAQLRVSRSTVSRDYSVAVRFIKDRYHPQMFE